MQTNIGKISLIIALLLTGLTLGAAQGNNSNQPASTIERGPGIIGAQSPFYGIEVAIDNAAVNIGLKNAGSVAEERAAEAKKAAENGNYQAAQKAAGNMNKIAEKASSKDVEGIQKAESVLQGVINQAPEEAKQGLQTALDNVKQARERAGSPEGTPGPGSDSEVGPQNETDRENDFSNSTDQERISEARDLMEDGRQQLREGNTALDQGNYTSARNEFGEATENFDEAIKTIENLNTAESEDLLQQLKDAKEIAENARDQAETQVDQQSQTTNTTTQNGGTQ